MNCKHCGAELEKYEPICPVCGKGIEADDVLMQFDADEKQAAAEKKAAKPAPAEHKPVSKSTKTVLYAIGGVAVALVAVFFVLTSLGINLFPGKGVNGSTATPKDSYTVSDEDAIAKAGEVVATMGDLQLTNGELQVYYWMYVQTYVSTNESNLETIGLDVTKPLDQQTYTLGETEMTWQQYFLDCALDSWHKYNAVKLHAEAEGFTLDDDDLETLAAIPEELESMASAYGYDSAAKMIADDMGAGSSVENYVSYLNAYYVYLNYGNEQYIALKPAMDEITAYYEQHKAEYTEQGLTQGGDTLVEVRHILCSPSGTADEDGNYEQSAWDDAEEKAVAVLDMYLANPSETKFAELAGEWSDDTGSATNGGLYTGVYQGQMVTEFNDWCFDAKRKAGDTDVIKTKYGYHVMYFVAAEEAWVSTVREDMQTARMNELFDKCKSEHPMTKDYSKIVLSAVELASA